MTEEQSGNINPDWNRLAAQLESRVSLERIHPRVLKWLKKKRIDAETWLVACSGGADSVFLCLWLYAWIQEKKLNSRIKLIHFNHGLRGGESDRDEHFVEAIAAGLGLEFEADRWNLQSTHPVTEAAARDVRLSFYREQVKSTPATAVFTGHQRDDIAESLLMRLARGSGSGGLAAPRPLHSFLDGRIHLRPLLNLSRLEIRHILTQLDIPWREDDTNESGHYLRNRLRSQVIPKWQEAVGDPDVSSGCAASRELIEEDDRALDYWLKECAKEADPAGDGVGDFRFLLGKPRALWRRAVYGFLANGGLLTRFTHSTVDRIIDVLRVGKYEKWSMGEEAALLARDYGLKQENCPRLATYSWKPQFVSPGSVIYFPNGCSLSVEEIEFRENSDLRSRILGGEYSESEYAWLNGDRNPVRQFMIRLWMPGDRYQPLGAPGRKKLHDLFIDRKIVRRERNQVPIVCLLDGTIVWCPGLPVADREKIGRDTRLGLRLTYRTT